MTKPPAHSVVLMEPKLTQLGDQISAEENKRYWNGFWSKPEAIIYLNFCLTKIIETSAKIQLDTHQTDFWFHHLQMYLWD